MAEPIDLHEIKGPETNDNDGSDYLRPIAREKLRLPSELSEMKEECDYAQIGALAEYAKTSNLDRFQYSTYATDRTSYKKWFIFGGVLLTISVILSITFGVMTYTLIMRTETLEAKSDELQAKIKTLEGTVTANNGTIQDARILKPETNTTVEHATEMTAIEANRQRISKLESIENDSKILYENMEFRLNYLEDGLNCTWVPWSSFTPCTATCGAGIHYRERSCDGLNPDFSEHWSSRIETDIQTCNIEICRQVNGGWTGWSSWSDCSATCGSGLIIRQRSCSSPQPANGGSGCSGEAIEHKSCEVRVCPVNGGWTGWSLWSGCSASCGSGLMIQQRSCSDPQPANGGSGCSGAPIEHKSCEIMVCPVNGGWTSWSSWSSCTQTCDGGEKTRHRYCTNPAPVGLGRSCTGTSDETSICNGNPCSVNGGWTLWSSWSSCTKTCEGGEKTRHRNCTNPAPVGLGRACIGNSDETSICNGQSCSGQLVDGGWSDWTDWFSCSTTCGTGQTTRLRFCINPVPANGGSVCPGSGTEQRICNVTNCPVNGGWTSWSSWSSCTQTCDEGEKTRHRNCTNPAPVGLGRACIGNSDETSICRSKPCSGQAVDGGWSDWTDCSNCSAICGNGQKFRLRFCSNPVPANGGSVCSGSGTEQKICKVANCTGVKSAFTVTSAVVDSRSSTLRFTHAITNIGGHYSTYSGIFSCQYPGMYVFSLYLVKRSGSSTYLYCSIRKNRSTLVVAHSYSYTSYYDSISNSVVIHLNSGDQVDVGSCSNTGNIYTSDGYTSFSGFLLTAD